MLKNAKVKLTLLVFIVIMMVIPGLPPGVSLALDGAGGPVIDPEVRAALDTEEFVPIIAFFTSLPESSFPEEENATRQDSAALIDTLQEKSLARAAAMEAALDEEIKAGNITGYRPLWIINAFAARVNREGLQHLASLMQIEIIRMDHCISLSCSRAPNSSPAGSIETPSPELSMKMMPAATPETETEAVADTDTYPWNLELINAPSLWQQGITGKDIVVAIMDTGVDPDHPALRDKYRGDLPGHSDATSWFDVTAPAGEPAGSPYDPYGHGTHVAGIILGGSLQEPLGVAPGARWIGVNIFEDGYTWDSHITQAFQWLLAPGGDPDNAPQIINCSWASRAEYVTDYLQWEILHILEQAGIFVVFAAGNNGAEGPGSPASYPHAFCAGALKKEGETVLVTDFSSRGPVNWQEMSFIKPEITAPGAGIRSAWLQGEYTVLDGTSIAAAHVSGSAALLLEAHPEISPAEIGYRLKQGARWLPSWDALGERPNGTYGYGMLDIAAAVAYDHLPPAELLFYDGAEDGMMNWRTSRDNPWKITREMVDAGIFAFTDSPWARYQDGAASWLALSKPISLDGYHDPVLSFRHFYDLPAGENRENDYAAVEFSTDGQNWARLFHFTGSSGEFCHSIIPLRLPAGAQNLYLRFRLQSRGNGPGIGWYIDEITVTARPRPLEELDELKITPERNKIGIEESLQIKAEALFGLTRARPLEPELLTWHSSNPSIAVVKQGKVTALAPGKVEIQGEFAGKTAQCQVEVVEVPPPGASPLPGTYINEITVRLAGEIPGLQIYYTMDGSEPDDQGKLYTDPLLITEDTLVKARAYREGIPGKIAVFNYTIREGGTLHGTVHLETGPFDPASIDAHIVSEDQGIHYEINFLETDGNFSIDLPLGGYKLVAAYPRYLTETTVFNIPEKGIFTLPPLLLPAGDLNEDGRINLSDLTLLALAYAATPGKGNWDPRADLNGDGRVNAADLTILVRNYGKSSRANP